MLTLTNPVAAPTVLADPTILPGSVIGGDAAATFPAELTLYSPDGTNCRTLTALVDTWMIYTVVPEAVLADLGIVPICEQRCHLPDGAVVKLPVAWVDVALPVKSGRALVAFGKDADQIIIGRGTLTGLALAADAANRRFIPVLLPL